MNRSPAVFAVLLVALISGACGITGPDEQPSLVVRGIVLGSAGPLEGAQVRLETLPSKLGPGPSGTGTTGADGRFELRVPRPLCESTMFFTVSVPGYVRGDLPSFSPNPCPGTVEGVRIQMVANPSLVIETESLAAGVPTLAYDEPLAADGGDYTYDWSITGGSLPEGLELIENRIRGTPSGPGRWAFTVKVTDGAGAAASADLAITVIEAVVLNPDESCGSAPDSAVVTFDEPDLLQAVRDQSGIGPEELLTCAEVTRMTEFDASGGTVRGYRGLVASLAGLQNLTRLTRLDLSWNEIERIDELAGLTGLVSLDLGSNYITDLGALAPLAALDTLRLSRNEIRSLDPLSELGDLRVLDLSFNRIVDAGPLSNLTSLVHLDLSWDELTALPSLDALDGLETLNLEGNKIVSLAGIEGLGALVELNASVNPLTDLGRLTELPMLRRLDLSRNDRSLEDLGPLAALPGLEELNLAFGAVSDLGPLGRLTTLEVLDLENNQVSDVGPLADLVGLRELRLQSNQLTDIEPLGGLESIVELDLLENAVTDVGALQGLATIRYLVLTANPDLSNIEPLITNPDLGEGDEVRLAATAVSCADADRLARKGVLVRSGCS